MVRSSNFDLEDYALETFALCQGTGRYNGKVCVACGGEGRLLVAQPAEKCTLCNGKGQLCIKVCPACSGTGWVRVRRR